MHTPPCGGDGRKGETPALIASPPFLPFCILLIPQSPPQVLTSAGKSPGQLLALPPGISQLKGLYCAGEQLFQNTSLLLVLPSLLDGKFLQGQSLSFYYYFFKLHKSNGGHFLFSPSSQIALDVYSPKKGIMPYRSFSNLYPTLAIYLTGKSTLVIEMQFLLLFFFLKI